MNKTFRLLAITGLLAAAAFGVSACKFGDKTKQTPPASAEPAPAAPDSSATAPASGAAVEAPAASGAAASGAAAAKTAG